MDSTISRRSSRWGVAAPIVCGCAIAGAAALLALDDPNEPGWHLPACPLYETTGLWCPGCGMTRATRSLLRGDVGAAFGSNLFFPLFLGAIVAGWLAWMRRGLGRVPLIALERMPMWVPAGLGATLIVFGVVRNLPGFEALQP
ncbi:MAG: DUF2752 domain-containing protein [Ilumatobacteraceae bacterium]